MGASVGRVPHVCFTLAAATPAVVVNTLEQDGMFDKLDGAGKPLKLDVHNEDFAAVRLDCD